ncbi:uncharacterized mitochondrial protein AtMg00810-like [Telopea speciosissima]|uniref:uncharacterized mitochondrial protein AtMg00810-like n=1 Tax=Telopea speciosissima TaxID=54955 RepID=UPI001CC7C52A|nr:uncharacterized mitochondrial protein AtMg00810-like [Telopea speciosissima]
MLGCHPTDTPIEATARLKEKEGEPVDKGRYQRLVGKLIYLSHTRPDIAVAVSLVSQFMHDPYSSHMEAVIRILPKSISRYCSFVGGNLVTWGSKKQKIVARSSVEAVFRAMTQEICELQWLKGLLQDIGVAVYLPMMLIWDKEDY